MPNGNQLYGGTLGDFDSSDNMAKEIEMAFDCIRHADPPVGAGIKQALPSGQNANDMRLLFIAIARGVIQHLVKNPAAFQVTVEEGKVVFKGGVMSVNAQM
jgi:hypothetical protein